MPSSFDEGLEPWLARLGNLRNVVRQELVTRQLGRHLPTPRATVLDLGAGQGTQAIVLARQGFDVTAVEPDERMLAELRAAVSSEPEQVRARVQIQAGALGDSASPHRGSTYDVVLCHGVLMYLPDPAMAVAELSAAVAPDGVLSLLVRNGQAMAWRPALRQDWAGALAMLDELELARSQGRDATYQNEIGVSARADSVERLRGLLTLEGLRLQTWYGVRVATDAAAVDQPPPVDLAELEALLEVEDRLGRTDPYRQVGTLLHLIATR